MQLFKEMASIESSLSLPITSSCLASSSFAKDPTQMNSCFHSCLDSSVIGSYPSKMLTTICEIAATGLKICGHSFVKCYINVNYYFYFLKVFSSSKSVEPMANKKFIFWWIEPFPESPSHLNYLSYVQMKDSSKNGQYRSWRQGDWIWVLALILTSSVIWMPDKFPWPQFSHV